MTTTKRPYRVWTTGDVRRIKAARSQDPPMPWRVLARQMGYRNWRVLACHARRLGVPVKPRRPRVDVARLRELVAAGHSRRRIAEQLGCIVGTVNYHCERLGLQTRGFRAGEVCRKHQRKVCREHGWQTFGDAIAEKGRLEAARMGWLVAETIVEARILQAIHELGPLDRRAISDHLGWQRDYKGRPSSYLILAIMGLHKRGLLTITGKLPSPSAHGGRPSPIYGLGAGVGPYQPPPPKGFQAARGERDYVPKTPRPIVRGVAREVAE